MIMYVNAFAVFIMCGGDTCDIGELLPGWLFDGPFISQVIGWEGSMFCPSQVVGCEDVSRDVKLYSESRIWLFLVQVYA